MSKAKVHQHHAGVSHKPEIQTMMILSTGHLSEDTNDDLSKGDDAIKNLAASFDCVRFGYLVWTGESLEQTNIDSCDESLRACMEYARHFSADYIKFDCDGPRVPFLAWHEW